MLERGTGLLGMSMPDDPELDSIAHKAASLCRTSMALISFVDEQRRWSSVRVGIAARDTPRLISFCTHAVRNGRTTVVVDASQDLRLAMNPLVKGEPELRFYAGVPLRTGLGTRLGTLCVLDCQPRALPADAIAELERLAKTVVTMLGARRSGGLPARRSAAA